MVLAKVMMAKADLSSTIAAVLAGTQSAAAAVGVLAVTRTPDGLLNVPSAELVLVCIVTVAVALALAVGCVRILTGRSPRLTIVGSVASLVISAYWVFLRAPAERFPDIAVAYAVLPVLTIWLLVVSRGLAARRARKARPAAAVGADSRPPDEPPPSELERPWESHDESEQSPRRDMLVE